MMNPVLCVELQNPIIKIWQMQKCYYTGKLMFEYPQVYSLQIFLRDLHIAFLLHTVFMHNMNCII